jgi:hypothetical protein
VKTLAGDGRGGCHDGKAWEAQFIDPKDLCVFAPERKVFVCDATNQSIRVISAHGTPHLFFPYFHHSKVFVVLDHFIEKIIALV